ncbi:unnamed protein product [Rotaria magnacalcarata]|nr:unnamed protein product [Rotaria magnacalcarata]
MVRKKSVASKTKSRRESYKRRQDVHSKISRSWRILIVTLKAFKKFLSLRRTVKNTSFAQKSVTISENDFIDLKCINYRNNKDVRDTFCNKIQSHGEIDDQNIIKDVVKKIVSRVCRLDSERKRQLKNRKHQRQIESNFNNENSSLTISRQYKWWRKNCSQNVMLREKESQRLRKFYQKKYNNNIRFREKERIRINSHVSTKYHTNLNARENIKSQSKINVLNKYHSNSDFRNKLITQSSITILNKYHNDVDFRNKHKTQSKIINLNKYHNNSVFRDKLITQSKINILNKYHSNSDFRNKLITQSSITILNKYHNDIDFRNEYKARMKTAVLKRYYTDNSIRLKMIQDALNWYRRNNTLTRQQSRQFYNQRRRILKKYSIIESHKCTSKHKNLYMENFKKFRNIIQEGPDYICISCGIALFRNQVVPFIEEKYLKQNMSFEMKEYIPSYFIDISSSELKWICRLCSDKIKKQQLPSRALLNKLEICEIPAELKKLNNLEKHLIALRLPFMKIVNLTSGKLSSR